MYTFDRWIQTPENQSATLAARTVADQPVSPSCSLPLLFLHGPPGVGKSHLTGALVARFIATQPDRTAVVLTSDDFNTAARPDDETPAETSPPDASRACDLAVVEDVQRLSAGGARVLGAWLDHRLARQRPTVFTATVGPGRLDGLPARLTSRLAAGVVVGLDPLTPESRLAYLRQGAALRRLALDPDLLPWLAERLGGSARQLEGVLTRLETLARLHPAPLTANVAAEAFRPDLETDKQPLERISRAVALYFQVDDGDLRSRGRRRQALLPRQIAMYLARQLTGMSLEQIGGHFGGRDHTTVLHACRKVADASEHDAGVRAALRQLRAGLL